MPTPEQTSPNQPVYFPAIDGLRFVAFLFVFFYHFNFSQPSKFLNYIGWTGVELFFLLSGFLLTKLLVVEYRQAGSIRLRKYFMRRILRIWPLYFCYLSAIALITIFLIQQPFSVSRLLGNIFFYDNILVASEGYNRNFAAIHLWSISLEEQYYLVLPFVIPWLIRQNRKRVKLMVFSCIILLLLSRFLLFMTSVAPYPLFYVLPLSGDSFLAGVILGLGIFDEQLKKIYPVASFFTGLSILALVYFLPDRKIPGLHHVFIYFFVAIAYCAFFISIVYAKNTILNILFSNKIVRYLGKISFGLYIFHLLSNVITDYFFKLLNISMDGWGFLASLLITIALAISSYELFEKHFLKMKGRFTVIKNREV